jgi:hypothetical protein
MRIVCPSGFAGEARKLRGSEIQAIADRLEEDATISDGSSTIVPLLAGVWLETTDAGPYSFLSVGTTKPEWSRLCKADVIGALFQVRVGSFRGGNIYQFPVQCARCNQRYDLDIDLQKHILDKGKPIPEATRTSIRTGAMLTAKLLDGREVKWKLSTMHDDVPAAKLRKQLVRAGERANDASIIVDQVALMVQIVEGRKPMNPRERWLWARDLELDEIFYLAEQFDAQSGGYETLIHGKCSNCKFAQEVDLPLGRTFLDPRKRIQSEEDETTMGTLETEELTTATTTSSDSRATKSLEGG